MRLDGKVAIVTGGAQGIGKAIARRFLDAGARVFLADWDAEAGAETLAEVEALGAVRFLKTDVSREADVTALIAATLDAFGRIDILVNNAGVSEFRALDDLTLEEWSRVLGVNLTSVFLLSKAASPYLRASRGVILNMASTRATMSEPDTPAYSASKGGIVALTHSLAISLGPEVRVNAISPGWIDVSGWKKRSARHPEELREVDHVQHPVGRVGRPEDVAEAALFLCSEAAGFITGENLVLDGGMTRKMIYAP